MDPSIRLHLAHHPIFFLGSLAGLMGLRVFFYLSLSNKTRTGIFYTTMDCVILLCLSLSWIEKRNLDQTRNGYPATRTAITLLLVCTPIAIAEGVAPILRRSLEIMKPGHLKRTNIPCDVILVRTLTVVFELLLAIIVVTGPSTAATILICVLQGWMMYLLAGATGSSFVSSCR